jgi:hypothetical protein
MENCLHLRDGLSRKSELSILQLFKTVAKSGRVM